MGLKGDQQAAAFQLWQQNERLVGSEELSRFYRQYLTSLARSSKPVKENEIYSDYRRYVGLTKDFDQIAQLKRSRPQPNYLRKSQRQRLLPSKINESNHF